MKKIIAGTLLVAAPMFVSADNGAGCGWGSLLMEGKTGWFAHTTAGTTNGTSYNQTFGMTSGTAGCDVSQPIDHASAFINSNIDKVAFDMSRGEGETLAALGQIFSIEQSDQAAFNQLLQDNFATIYSSSTTTSNKMVSTLVELMSADLALAKYAS